jgi:DNA-binding NtrC family response regulator
MDTSATKPTRSLKSRVEAYERRLIMAALTRTGGNQQRAALMLGVRPTTLNEKLRRLGIGVLRQVVELERPAAAERERVMAALEAAGGRISRAAAQLGVSRTRLRSELRQLGIGVARTVRSAGPGSGGDELVGVQPAQREDAFDHLADDVVGSGRAGGEADRDVSPLG